MRRRFKKCFITGITGAGGSYLAEYILKKEKSIKIFGSYRSAGIKIFYKKGIKIKLDFLKLISIIIKNLPAF